MHFPKKISLLKISFSSSQAPIRQVLSSQAPISQLPSTRAPVSQAPVTQAPTTILGTSSHSMHSKREKENQVAWINLKMKSIVKAKRKDNDVYPGKPEVHYK